MLRTVRSAWKVPELRKKILYTLLIVVIFRIGSLIPVPFLNPVALKLLMQGISQGNNALNFLNTFSGGAFSQGTLFAMSVSPYINSSIIIQLMTVVIPALERLSSEGEDGRKKVGAITRYLTVFLGVAQGFGYYWFFLRKPVALGLTAAKYLDGFEAWFSGIVIISTFTAGVALMMWLGEQVNKKGMGNGISILLFAGIVSRMPEMIGHLWDSIQKAIEHPDTDSMNYLFVVLFILLFLGLVWIIVLTNDAERRIPIQYAKSISGRKMYGGQSSHLPVKIGLAGVMPVIFASTLLSMPGTIALFFNPETGWFRSLLDALSPDSWIYVVIFSIFILLFAYFYIAIQYNPIEIANNLRQSNGTIPGIRPGKPTADYISKVFSKITLIGALFLMLISLLPMGFSAVSKMSHLSLGGTSIIILVGVALETVKQMDSQIMQKHHKGFLG
ncbi:MAG: preprotein translocase subunit SecY [Oscillospiraceae bacterium]|nr:preprotein translocase subunit SecY [Oscillospiraceae bacterium]